MTKVSGKNPFRPGVGTRPLFLAGRDAPTRRFLAALRAAPEQPANVRLTGLRGVGKTVLLAELEEKAASANWAAASLELTAMHNDERALLVALSQLLENARSNLSRIQKLKKAIGKAAKAAGSLGVTFNDIKVSLDPALSTEHTRDLAGPLLETVAMALKQGREGFVLLLDEAQAVRDDRDRDGEHPLTLLISAISALQRKEVPLGLVLCGLPTLTGNLLRARSYTERMFRGEDVGRLDKLEAVEALTEPLKKTTMKADDKVVSAVVKEVEGYPYFIQLWGAELWDAAAAAETDVFTAELLKAATPDIYRRLDVDFYEPRVATLTPAEQDVLLATAQCSYPPLETINLNDAVEKSPGNINVILGRLVEAGVLYRVRKGQYEYTAPKFREYLQRRKQ